ncbi:MAG: type II toxin-antitoxin system HipA family toxin [Planctomycetota bacterium]|nr:MAG: type II toxin-antitoxin system HipA family toxin [Planctomycetota bacterium]
MSREHVELVMDIGGHEGPIQLGTAFPTPTGRGSVRIAVELGAAAVASAAGATSAAKVLGTIDPDLRWHEGQHYAPAGVFGFLRDSSPDRWGRRLMDRRRARERRLGVTSAPARLNEWDYLLGVDDRYRLGALRLRRPDGQWCMPPGEREAPPFIHLRRLQQAAQRVEDDAGDDHPDEVDILLQPGSSLGGARPKATVVDPAGSLWIAKFPSTSDTHDVGMWEVLTNGLARSCGITAPEMRAVRVLEGHHIALIQRFDRRPDGSRIHVASAMTMTGNVDGAGAASGAGYLDIAEALITYGADPTACLQQLWRRIVFHMLVANADDHLRNHAFLLRPGKGWLLAPAYDINPLPGATALSLNVSEAENAIDLDLALSVAEAFRIPHAEARKIMSDMRASVAQWRKLARHYQLSSAECDRMADAFHLAT